MVTKFAKSIVKKVTYTPAIYGQFLCSTVLPVCPTKVSKRTFGDCCIGHWLWHWSFYSSQVLSSMSNQRCQRTEVIEDW